MSPFDGIDAKLRRVQILGEEFATEAAQFAMAAEAACTLSQNFSEDGRICVLSVSGEAKPSFDLAVRAGEIVHHLRSALDHAVVALASTRGIPAQTSHQYPIVKTQRDFERALERKFLEGLSPSQVEAIRLQQSFSLPDIRPNPLTILNDLNNTDKHRLLLIVHAAATIEKDVTISTDEDLAERLGIVATGRTIVNLMLYRNTLNPSGAPYFAVELLDPDPTLIVRAPVQIDVSLNSIEQLEFPKAVPLLVWLRDSVVATINGLRQHASA